jgi:hypothetical protein
MPAELPWPDLRRRARGHEASAVLAVNSRVDVRLLRRTRPAHMRRAICPAGAARVPPPDRQRAAPARSSLAGVGTPRRVSHILRAPDRRTCPVAIVEKITEPPAYRARLARRQRSSMATEPRHCLSPGRRTVGVQLRSSFLASPRDVNASRCDSLPQSASRTNALRVAEGVVRISRDRTGAGRFGR